MEFRTVLDELIQKFLAWRWSLNAKVFLVIALLTGILTVAVAFLVIGGFRVSIESYTRGLALSTARGAAEDINRLDPELRYRRETAEMLAIWANPESVQQIDIFVAARIDGEDYIEPWATSSGKPEEVTKNDADIYKMLEYTQERAELVTLESGEKAWCVYVPVQSNSYGRPMAILRAYCALGRWNALWKDTYILTLKILPIVLIIEYVLLWVLTSAFVRRPMQKILYAMKSLGCGDASARANLVRQDELGQIARHFDDMAAELQKAGQERETLLAEIQGFNKTLQGRINEALARNLLLREELGQQERMAVAGQLAAAFAHEVGTPLNLVNSHLQLLISEPETDSQTRARLETICAQIDRVGEIVEKLLGHTRPMEPKLKPLHFQALLDELQQLWAPALAIRNAHFVAHVPKECILNADSKQLEQLLINLVNNALDAMPDGGEIVLEATKNQAQQWEFALSDAGQGIPEENVGKLFKPMFTTKPGGKGTGLGLAICREIVRAHGGEIRIGNNQGRGAVVKFSIEATTNF